MNNFRDAVLIRMLMGDNFTPNCLIFNKHFYK